MARQRCKCEGERDNTVFSMRRAARTKSNSGPRAVASRARSSAKGRAATEGDSDEESEESEGQSATRLKGSKALRTGALARGALRALSACRVAGPEDLQLEALPEACSPSSQKAGLLRQPITAAAVCRCLEEVRSSPEPPAPATSREEVEEVR